VCQKNINWTFYYIFKVPNEISPKISLAVFDFQHQTNKYFHIFTIAYCLIKFDLLMTQLLIFCRGAASKEKAMDGDKERVLPGDSQILSGKLLAGWVVSGRNG